MHAKVVGDNLHEWMHQFFLQNVDRENHAYWLLQYGPTSFLLQQRIVRTIQTHQSPDWALFVWLKILYQVDNHNLFIGY